MLLLVEDLPADAELVLHALRRGGYHPQWIRVETKAELCQALDAGTWDVVLSDYNLPEFGAPEALEVVRAIDSDLPFIVVSGTVGEEVAIATMSAGANDYVFKHNLARLAPAIERELREAGNRRARRAAERQAQQLAAIVSDTDYSIITQTLDGIVTTWNPGAERLYGYTAGEAVGRGVSLIFPPGRADDLRAIRERVGRGESVPAADTTRLHKDGSLLDVSVGFSPVRDARGRVVGMSGIGANVAERKRVERGLGLFRALIDQTMDAIEVIDPETGRFLDVNERACAAHGYTREEYLSLSVPDLDPIVAAMTWKAMLEANQLAGSKTFESLHRRKDGSTFPVEVNFNTIRLERDYMVAVVRDITDRKQAEEALRQSQERLRHVIASSPAILFKLVVEGEHIREIAWVSENVEEVLGYPPSAALDKDWWAANIHPEDRERVAAETERGLVASGRVADEYRFRHRKGQYRWIRSEVRLVLDAMGESVEAIGSWSDVTDRHMIEEQYRQAQKMEAFGQLAGGVAHDFNNLLTIINGYGDMLVEGLAAGDPRRDSAAEICAAGERAAALTAQLLAFSRKTIVEPRVLDLNEIVGRIGTMLSRLIGEDVTFSTKLTPALGRVKADPGQVEQILMNLAVNARDAMPLGGRLTIETRNVEVAAARPPLGPGHLPTQWVQVLVSDTGTGMTDEVRAKIFEPFFTTKGVGKGTGLGLATVYGIVKQAGGQIDVTSEVGVGTSFSVLLPAVAVTTGPPSALASALPTRGTETVLLAEDEHALRKFARRALEAQGYKVLEATNGVDAIRVAEEYGGCIHALVTDVVMPEMGGRDLADALRARQPSVRVLFMSGYTDDALFRHGVVEATGAFLQKPFSPLGLARKVRAVLDGEKG